MSIICKPAPDIEAELRTMNQVDGGSTTETGSEVTTSCPGSIKKFRLPPNFTGTNRPVNVKGCPLAVAPEVDVLNVTIVVLGVFPGPATKLLAMPAT